MGIMKKTCNIVLASGLLLVSLPSFAYTINLTVTPEKVTYENGYLTANSISISGNSYPIVATSDWESTPQEGLMATAEWQPGLFTSDVAKFPMNAGFPDGLPIKVLGLEYNYGVSQVQATSPSLMTGVSPGVSSDTGMTYELYSTTSPSTGVFVQNAGVRAQHKISYSDGSSRQPFYFTRPIFYIDEQALISALALNGDTAVTYYTGTVPVNYLYYHKPWSVTTVRNMMSTLTVNITYIPSILTSITAEDEVTLVADYDTDAQTVSSEPNHFNVIAKGMFETGIKMTFQNRDYHLDWVDNPRDPTATSTKFIPYYVRCPTCNITSIVEAGVLQNPTQEIEHAVGTDKTTIQFQLAVGYEDIAADDVDTGNYRDTFVVLFEVIL